MHLMTTLEIDGVTGTRAAAAAPSENSPAPATREVRHEFTHTLPSLLSQIGVSLLVSTYQAGKVVAVGVAQGELILSYHNFERAMRLAEKGAFAPRSVAALSETDTPQGWRPNKATSGCLIDVASGETVARGFAMPHSPRIHNGRIWMLHSGAGQLVQVDPARGHVQTVTELPGYTRGLPLYARFAFVGLSKIREPSTSGAMPIADRRSELKCGVGVVDLETGRLMAHLEFITGVEEIFDVQVVPGARCPALSGPYPNLDSAAPIWIVPQAGQAFQHS